MQIRKFQVGADRGDGASPGQIPAPSTPRKRGALSTPNELYQSCDFIASFYSPNERDMILLVTRSEILFLDVKVSQIVSTISGEPRGPHLVGALLCREHPDLLVTLNEAGRCAVLL